MRRVRLLALLPILTVLAAPGSAVALQDVAMQGPGGGAAIVRLDGIGAGISQKPGPVGVVGADGRVRRLALVDGRLALTDAIAAEPSGGEVRPSDMLADGEVTYGSADIARAWLTDPTERYRHGILGDRVEAAGLALETRGGAVHRYRLDAGSVFEDRRVRLFDLDRDGRDEAIVVQSYLDAGAALTVLALDANGIRYVAEVPAIGRPNRWLNPAGVGDFDGDGANEVAFVETPHIGGTLRLYELRDGKLREDAAAPGFSNHGIGTREQELSAVHDWTGDGVVDLAVPDARRRGVRFVTFAGGAFREFDRTTHSAPIVTAIRPAILDASGHVYAVYGLADATIHAVRPGSGN